MFRLRSHLQSVLPNRSLGLGLLCMFVCALVGAYQAGMPNSFVPPVAAAAVPYGQAPVTQAFGGSDPYPAPGTPTPVASTATAVPTQPPTERDTVAPRVESLVIEGGADSTTKRQVVFDAVASDDGGSGVASLLYIEYEYVANVGWSPVRISGWLPYAEASTGYSWTLGDSSGVHYVQAWVADGAGNVATSGAADMINYVPAQSQAAQHERKVYRQALDAGQTLRVRLTSLNGDADLFVWSPHHGEALRFSNASDGVTDEVLFTATKSGVYQIEVHGYTDAQYQLDIRTMGTSRTRPAVIGPIGTEADKPLFGAPAISLNSEPSVARLPLAPGQMQKVFLPMVRR